MDRWVDRRAGVLMAIVALCLIAIVLFADAAVARAASATGSVQITATVTSRIDVSFDDDRLTVRSNIPWQVSAYSPDGERWLVSGGPTAGSELAVPEGTTGVEVCTR